MAALRVGRPIRIVSNTNKESDAIEGESCMRSKAVRYVCGICGAELRGIGDWVEHICPAVMPKVPSRKRQASRLKTPANATEMRPADCATNRIMMLSEGPTKTFEQLLTTQDRAWMRDIEKAFTS